MRGNELVIEYWHWQHFHIGNIYYVPQPSNTAEHCCHMRAEPVCAGVRDVH